jgi:hypothetical protein
VCHVLGGQHLTFLAVQVPKERAKTRWEEFRLQKGIEHKKRERMLWDEKTGKYRPRWGKDRASNEEEWAVPAKASDGMLVVVVPSICWRLLSGVLLL